MESGSDAETAQPDYPSLARAVRGPMRRWWARTCLWWIPLLVLSLGFRLLVSFKLWKISNYIPNSTEITYSEFYKLLGCIAGLIAWPGALLVWLAAAVAANRAFDALFPGGRVPDGPGMARLRFDLGLRQGLIPWLAYAVCGYTYSISHQISVQPHAHLTTTFGTWWWFFWMPSWSCLILVVWMLWLLGLYTAAYPRGWPAWTWLTGTWLLKPLAVIVTAAVALYADTRLPTLPQGGVFFRGTPGLEFLIALACGIAMIHGFNRRLPGLAWTGFGGVLACSLVFPFQWFNRALPSFFFNLNRPFQFLPASLTPGKGEGYARLDLALPATLNIPTGAALHFVVIALYLLVNLAWIALLYRFIRNVLLRPRRTPGPEAGD